MGIVTKPDIIGQNIAQVSTSLCSNAAGLQDVISKVEEGMAVSFCINGDFSLHQLILGLCQKFGIARLTLSTYALRELPARQLAMAMDQGLIRSIDLVIDTRAKIRTENVMHFARQNFNVYLANVHAKVCVLQFFGISITIVGSQNLTTNPKLESGIIITDATTAEFFIKHLRKIMTNESKY